MSETEMLDLVSGWTWPIEYQLLDGGQPTDLTNKTVSLSIRTSAGAPVNPTGTLSIIDPALGKVRFTPAAGDITSSGSPWLVRFVVQSGASKAYYPSGVAETWIIRD